MSSRTRITSALIGLIVLVLAGWLVREQLPDDTPPRSDSGLTARALSELPVEAADTWRLIEQGGPFPFPQDGVVFENREKLLPSKESGYYREYTVLSTGDGDRGPRRLVRGEGGELYYTDDHYRSFVVVQPGR